MAKEFNPEKFKIIKKEDIYNGPHSEIDSVTLSSGEHSLNLLRKKFRGYSVEFMDGPRWHTLLKDKGYPVFPTLRYDEKTEVEYITDLRQKGTHKVIDFCNHHSKDKVYISNIKELETDIKKLLDKSVKDGLVINEPNIFFDIENDTGIAKVILGDLRELGYGDIDEDYIPTKQDIFKNNEHILKEHTDRLKSIMVDNLQ